VKAKAPKTARAKAKAKAQSTLTQVWDGSTPGLISKPSVISDSDEEVEVTSTPASRTPATVVRHRQKLSPKSVKQTRQVAFSQVEDALVKPAKQENTDGNSVQFASNLMDVVPRTPRAVRWEVPSSQTPASIKLSAENSPGKRELFSCSPFGKHVSVPMQDDIGEEMCLSDVGLRHSPSKSATKPRHVQVKATMTQTSTQSPSLNPEQEGSPTPQKPKLKLKHISTVEDSDEEPELSGPLLTADQDQLQSALEESIRLRDYTQFQPSNAFTQYPQTYDPVSAALSRDAARFEDETQTQSSANLTGAPTPSRSPHRLRAQTDRAPIGIARSIIHSSSLSLIPSSPDIPPRHVSDSSLPIMVSSSAPPVPESDDATLTIPDSPHVLGARTPRMRSSQMSTMVPSSPAEFLARLHSVQKSPNRQDFLGETPRRRETTITKPAQPGKVVFSSSPIPLPPWSEDETQVGVQRRDMLLAGDEMFDESLPPPPPGWSFAPDGGSDLDINRR
jgi:hypothetical protein